MQDNVPLKPLLDGRWSEDGNIVQFSIGKPESSDFDHICNYRNFERLVSEFNEMVHAVRAARRTSQNDLYSMSAVPHSATAAVAQEGASHIVVAFGGRSAGMEQHFLLTKGLATLLKSQLESAIPKLPQDRQSQH